jgi:peptide deformylase
MSPLKIITVPDPVLKTVAQPVAKVDDVIRRQMDDMLGAMYNAPGIGLAANQVSMLNRVLVMDIEAREGGSGKKPIFMANPEIILASEETSVMEEGCLSIPGQFADIARPAKVRVKYLDYNNAVQELEADGLLSHCVQHEIDHLNGVLFVDYLSSLKRNMMLRKVSKMMKDHEAL